MLEQSGGVLPTDANEVDTEIDERFHDFIIDEVETTEALPSKYPIPVLSPAEKPNIMKSLRQDLFTSIIMNIKPWLMMHYYKAT